MMKKGICIVLLIGAVIGFSSCNDSEFGATNKVKTYEERYKELEEGIRSSPEWLASIEKKAKEQNIPLDSMIKLDITWTIDEQDGKHKPDNQPVVSDTANKKPYEERLKEIVAAIRSSAGWMAAIAKKAKGQQVSIDSMVMMDARWMLDEQDGKHK